MSLAWCQSKDYCTSAIIGATNLQQLKENCEPFLEDAAPLSEETLQRINAIHMSCPNPILDL